MENRRVPHEDGGPHSQQGTHRQGGVRIGGVVLLSRRGGTGAARASPPRQVLPPIVLAHRGQRGAEAHAEATGEARLGSAQRVLAALRTPLLQPRPAGTMDRGAATSSPATDGAAASTGRMRLSRALAWLSTMCGPCTLISPPSPSPRAAAGGHCSANFVRLETSMQGEILGN